MFNDALLVKQTWRLLHDKTSLFYRVFKSKLFPNGTIMEAGNPSSASYAWRSIIRGREVIKKGAILGMANLLTYGQIVGCLENTLLEYYPLSLRH